MIPALPLRVGRALLLLAAAALPATAQSVLRVDASEPGAFPDLQAAVDAAADGDVLLVGPGAYAGCTIAAKGLVLVGAEAGTGGTSVTGPIEVSAAPAGSATALVRLALEGAPALRVVATAGAVRVSECTTVDRIEVVGSPDVAVARSTVGTDPAAAYPPASIVVEGDDALLALHDAVVRGKSWAPLACMDGGDGVRFRDMNGYLFASGCDLPGGDAGSCALDGPCPACPSGGDGLHGEEALGADLTGTTLSGGNNAEGNDSGFCICCEGCWGDQGVPVDVPAGSTVSTDSGPWRRFSTVASATEGTGVLARFVGAPGDAVVLRVSTTPQFVVQGPVTGPSLVGGAFQDVPFGTLGATGTLNATWTLPGLGGAAARVLFVQAIFVDGGGSAYHRTPAVVVVLSADACLVGPAGTRYCSPVANSTGQPALMDLAGSTSVSANDLELRAFPVPPLHSGVFVYSPDQASTPLGNGVLCVGNQTLGFVLRLPSTASDAAGLLRLAVDNTQPPHPAGQLVPGATFHFSAWYRDLPAGGSFFNFADGLTITFCP